MELQKYCTDFISKEPDKIFKSPNFSSISEKLLISLIQGDNLLMTEIQVWEHVLKWGLAQNPELPSNPTNFSKEDFNILKNNLHQCIPFIRFYNLTSEEFSEKVLPYRKMFPKESYQDLLKYFLNPNNQSIKNSRPRVTTNEIINVDSKLITLQYVELISKDEFKAFEAYLKLAGEGISDAQNNLGYCYQNGIGITKDEKKAFEWYLKAANEGNLYAQYNLGICYQNGIGINKDDKKALEYYIKSAERGNSDAQNKLGNCYQNEIGTEKDSEEAIYWYNEAAENGNKYAQYNLGNFYKNGECVKKDENKAFEYYKKSAGQEYLDAQF